MWYKPVNGSVISTPGILLYPDRIRENIRRMIHLAGGAERLRPHVKTHKIAEIVELQIQGGIDKFKSATLSELAMVAAAGGSDILLAYPLLGPAVGMWYKLLARYPDKRLSVTVDSEEALAQLQDQMPEGIKRVELFVDVDNGMHRTGIDPERAMGLIASIVKNPNLNFRGLHIYDGHIHEVDPAERKAHCDRDFEAVSSLLKQLKKNNIEVEELACGGTPTFPIHAACEGRIMCPGTPLLWDAGYSISIPDLDFLPAAVVCGRVISKPEGQVCLDLGYKSIASEMDHPRLHFLEFEMNVVINHSEEHLVLESRARDQLSIGDVVYALPHHICPTMALHEEVYVVKNQKISETWKVLARKRNYPI